MLGRIIDNFNIHFNTPNERDTYSSGDMLTGHVSFDLTKESVINAITLTLKGKASVAWSTGTGKSRQRIKGKLEYINMENVVMKNDDACVPSKLQAGNHVYPFTFQIPPGDFPSSFHGFHGQIVYSLLVGIDRPWHLTKEFLTEFKFAGPVIQAEDYPQLLNPLAGNYTGSQCCLCCASGPISMDVHLERRAFHPGEVVKITCEFSNGTSRIATPKTSFFQRQEFFTNNRMMKITYMEPLGSRTWEPLSPGSCHVYTEMLLTVPSNAPFTIGNCILLEVDYVIEVRLCFKGASDLTMTLPIIICNIPENIRNPPLPHIGDCLSGTITLELAKDCKIDSLRVALKGKANVKWTESYGNTHVTYSAKEKYFSIKQFIIEKIKGQDSTTVARGNHVYPFTLQIPLQDLPSSFKGTSGKIKYTLKAFLSRSMKMDSKAKAEITVISKTNSPELMAPQHDIKDHKLNVFNSGKVFMDVNINKMGFFQGEGMKVTAYIQNNSSRDIKPKYCFYSKTSYFAKRKRKVSTKKLVKEVGEPIPPSSSQNVTRIITVPPTTDISILNGIIIKHEYRLKVYLDVKYVSDPELKFPIVILPASETPALGEPPACGSYGFEAFGNPTASEPSAPPPTYGAYSIYPSLSST